MELRERIPRPESAGAPSFMTRQESDFKQVKRPIVPHTPSGHARIHSVNVPIVRGFFNIIITNDAQHARREVPW